MTIAENLIIHCPDLKCAKPIVLPPLKGKRPGLRTGQERTGVSCPHCGLKFAYWGRPDQLKFKIPINENNGFYYIGCIVCAVTIELEHGVFAEDSSCNTCGCMFMYRLMKEFRSRSSPTGVRRVCFYPTFINLSDAIEVWKHRLATEASWVRPNVT